MKPFANDDQYLLTVWDRLQGHCIPGGIQLQPAAVFGNEALDAQDMAVPCALQQRACGPLQLLCRAAQLEKIQRGERFMLIKVQLDIACLLPPAAVDAFPVRICLLYTSPSPRD